MNQFDAAPDRRSTASAIARLRPLIDSRTPSQPPRTVPADEGSDAIWST
jgi:hypothetical protein